MERRKKTLPRDIVEEFRDVGRESVLSDVNGSYTGTPTDGYQPVQDADDL